MTLIHERFKKLQFVKLAKIQKNCCYRATDP